ncbi:hypothetical protein CAUPRSCDRAFT_12794, partial [Caulochytrium protostelioides]
MTALPETPAHGDTDAETAADAVSPSKPTSTPMPLPEEAEALADSAHHGADHDDVEAVDSVPVANDEAAAPSLEPKIEGWAVDASPFDLPDLGGLPAEQSESVPPLDTEAQPVAVTTTIVPPDDDELEAAAAVAIDALPAAAAIDVLRDGATEDVSWSRDESHAALSPAFSPPWQSRPMPGGLDESMATPGDLHVGEAVAVGGLYETPDAPANLKMEDADIDTHRSHHADTSADGSNNANASAHTNADAIT